MPGGVFAEDVLKLNFRTEFESFVDSISGTLGDCATFRAVYKDRYRGKNGLIFAWCT